MKNFIIVCAGLKGGGGKSTVCANLAMHLIDQGIPVIVYDADIQQTLVRHRQRELAEHPDAQPPYQLMPFSTADAESVKANMAQLKAVPAVVLIDCPGNIQDACLQHIYEAADIAVVPTRYDFDNLDATVLFSEMFIKISKAKMFFVPNCINAIEERREEIQKARDIAKKMLEKYGTVTARIKQWAPEDRPTERLQRLGAESLTDAELLAILIGSGTQQYSAVDIGNQVLGKFNHNLNTLGKARFDEILDIEGVGTQTACKILAAVELGKRRQIATPELHPEMSTATRIYNYMLPKMQDLATEEFHILLINQNFRLIKSERISQGGITEVSADIRIMMREAVLNNATIMAVCHNHPSGSIRPSRIDDTLTQSVKKTCEVMRIHFLDHVIVTDGAYYSYHEQGKL